jgi:hypothetical protein
MAAGLGFKEFTTGDVLTAADANGYLASQVVMVFASAAARTSAITSPQEGMISYLKDTNSTEYYSGSAWVAIGGGGSSGKILQVVSATKTDTSSVTSSTFTDISGLSVSITPAASTSKVLIFWSTSLATIANATGLKIRMMRDSTAIGIGDAASNRPRSTGGFYIGDIGVGAPNNFATVAGNFLDSPSTTSATTYKLQFCGYDGTNTVYINRTTADRDTTGFDPRLVSSITVMEVGA